MMMQKANRRINRKLDTHGMTRSFAMSICYAQAPNFTFGSGCENATWGYNLAVLTKISQPVANKSG